MLHTVLAVVVISAAAAQAQELLSIEIVGPTEVQEQTETQYHCIAHFDNGDVDVTGEADWSVAPPLPASIDAGVLAIDDLQSDVVLLVRAHYAADDDQAETSREVTVHATGPTLVDMLYADDAVTWQLFGSPIAAGNAIAVIGAPEDDEDALAAGAAYLFDLSTHEQRHKLHSTFPDQGDRFGSAVGVSGNLVAVGAPRDWTPNGVQSGSVSVFNASTGELIKRLRPDEGDDADHFGFAVGISGNIVIAGAPNAGNLQSGAAYIFNATTGEELFAFENFGPFDQFGEAVAISGDRAIVCGDGLGHVYDVTTGQKIGELAPDPDGHLGSVAIDGSTAILGSSSEDGLGENTGAAYAFDIPSGALISKLRPEPGWPNAGFGEFVDISGGVAIVGERHNPEHGIYAGAAYLFDVQTGALIAKLLPDQVVANDNFGHAVAIDGASALVGAPYDDDPAPQGGAVYVYSLSAQCAPDLNGDGALNILDFITFQLSWQAAISSADCNGDESFDILDFVCYQQLFQQGCPGF